MSVSQQLTASLTDAVNTITTTVNPLLQQLPMDSIEQYQTIFKEQLSKLNPSQKRNVQALGLLAVVSTVVKQKRAALLSLALNLLLFNLQAWPNKSDKYYDTIGSSTHLVLALFSVFQQKHRPSHSQVLNTAMVVMWATRLGSFLYTRILVHKKDSRFDSFKQDYFAFMLAFVMQSLWCYLGQLPLLISNSKAADKDDESLKLASADWKETLGRGLFFFGFAFELISDAQKTAFHADPSNEGKFITEGLWSLSRHPNHFGEICLQFGICLSCSKYFRTWTDQLAWTSPIFTFFLLTQVSGVPMLEKAGMKKWGTDPSYMKYLQATPMLVPKLF